LRDLAARDCWMRAWLRFGRVPVVQNQRVFDLRFSDRRTQEFTHMSLVRRPDAPECPPWIPKWQMPREDILSRPTATVFRN
jgi:inner membrane protein